MSLNGRLAISMYSTLTRLVGNVTVAAPLREYWSLNLADGSGANQATGEYSASGNINASGSALFDFWTGGGLLDPTGTAIAWTKMKFLMVKNTHATQPFAITSTITGLAIGTVRPGGVLLHYSPDATSLALASDSAAFSITNGSGSSTSYIVAAIGV